MEEAGMRLREARGKLKITQAVMGKPFNFTYSKIRDLESGKQKITLELAMGFEEKFSISSSWLLHGKGDMLTTVLGQGSGYYGHAPAGTPQIKGHAYDTERRFIPDRPADAFDIPPPAGKIPIISWAQAGPDGFFLDSFPAGSGYGDINRPYDITDPNAYALIISGDSMAPKYEPGDVILVSPNMGVQTGDYAVVKLRNGSVAAKRVKARNGGFTLESINPEYPPINCDSEDVVFLHRIVWVKQRG
jgi:phage repressor protein C with HTH and peptisase S24 domain/DNA-binding XRE family transcriptional regulator